MMFESSTIISLSGVAGAGAWLQLRASLCYRPCWAAAWPVAVCEAREFSGRRRNRDLSPSARTHFATRRVRRRVRIAIVAVVRREARSKIRASVERSSSAALIGRHAAAFQRYGADASAKSRRHRPGRRFRNHRCTSGTRIAASRSPIAVLRTLRGALDAMYDALRTSCMPIPRQRAGSARVSARALRDEFRLLARLTQPAAQRFEIARDLSTGIGARVRGTRSHLCVSRNRGAVGRYAAGRPRSSYRSRAGSNAAHRAVA